MITLSIPSLYVMLCILGWILVAIWIGPEKPRTGTYGFDLVTPVLHLINLFVWIIVTLVGLLLWEVCTK